MPASRPWDSGLNDPAIQYAIQEQFAGFQFDAIPDQEQPVEVAFLEFAERLVAMMPASQYVLGGLNSLEQARVYFVEAWIVAKEQDE